MVRSEMINVIVFTDSFLETSGVGTYYRTLIDWFKGREDVRITVVCPDPVRGDDYEPTAEVIVVRPRFRRQLPLYPDVTVGLYSQTRLRQLADNLPDPKVIHIASSGPLGVAAARMARNAGLPLVGCYHTDMLSRGRVYGRKMLGRAGEWIGERAAIWLDRRAYGRCSAVYAPSVTASTLAGQILSGSAQTIPNPVNINRFRPSLTRDGWFRQRYGRPGTVLAVAVGRVAREKNVHELCRLVAPDARVSLVLVGGGPESDALRNQWNIQVTGFLQGSDLVDAYQQSDVFVQASVSETFGLCLAEALACGLPAVVLRGPGLAGSIPPGNGVEVLEPTELHLMAGQCVALVSDRPRYDESARQARAFARHWSTEGVMPEWIRFHQEAAQ